jgi:hypothetical protein
MFYRSIQHIIVVRSSSYSNSYRKIFYPQPTITAIHLTLRFYPNCLAIKTPKILISTNALMDIGKPCGGRSSQREERVS